jgi:hypothetical protein
MLNLQVTSYSVNAGSTLPSRNHERENFEAKFTVSNSAGHRAARFHLRALRFGG